MFSRSLSLPSPATCNAVLPGNTVIHLDKALARMREYERMKLKAEFSPNTTAATASEASANSSASAAQLLEGTLLSVLHLSLVEMRNACSPKPCASSHSTVLWSAGVNTPTHVFPSAKHFGCLRSHVESLKCAVAPSRT